MPGKLFLSQRYPKTRLPVHLDAVANFTSPILSFLRRLLRASRLTGPISTLLGLGGYEHRFNSSLLTAVRPGDRIWDVGANIGHYTMQLAELAGPSGRVFAFEPSSTNLARLRETTAGLANVTSFELALSDHSGRGAFRQGDDELGATSRVAHDKESGDHVTAVQMVTGDDVIARGWAEAPNILKIDVEGHEFEVLRGFCNQFRHCELRHVFMEVHFRLLDEAGRSDVPGKIVTLLETAGFDITWIDPSHLHARKISAGAGEEAI
jgi:FkbM family methyltransferase